MYQAERKLRTSTHIPDLDNANVGTYILTITGDTLVYLPFILRRQSGNQRFTEGRRCFRLLIVCGYAVNRNEKFESVRQMNKENLRLNRSS